MCKCGDKSLCIIKFNYSKQYKGSYTLSIVFTSSQLTYLSLYVSPVGTDHTVGIVAFTMTTNHMYEWRKQLIRDKHDVSKSMVSKIQACRLLYRVVGVPDTRSQFRRSMDQCVEGPGVCFLCRLDHGSELLKHISV